MKEKILALAHFATPVHPQKLALMADKIWGLGYHRALTIVREGLKSNALKVVPNTGRIFYEAQDPKNPETDPVIKNFVLHEDIDKIMLILEENDAQPA